MRDVKKRQVCLRLGLMSLALLLSWHGYVSVVSWRASSLSMVFGPVPLFAASAFDEKLASSQSAHSDQSDETLSSKFDKPDTTKAKDKARNKVKVRQVGNEMKVEQVGEASWYGSYHQGKKTASGEKYDQHDLTAAHPSLPLGTEAVVTNLETGESVKVEITDRGPYVKGREIDLSRAAAKEIGTKEDGVASVKIEATIPADSVAIENPSELKEKIEKRQLVKKTTQEE